MYIKSPTVACDSPPDAPNDFYNYYGLRGVQYNPLLFYRAEQLENLDNKCVLFYDYMSLLPTNVPILSKSMIVQAPRGAGKTHVRECIISQIPKERHIQLKIYGKTVDQYLDKFLSNIDVTSEPQSIKIQKYWTQQRFLQLILTELVSNFVNSKYLQLLKEERSHFSFHTREEIATLLAFYTTTDPDTLCKMVNILLFEKTECFVWDCNIKCDKFQSTDFAKDMFISLKEKHNEIKVKRHTSTTTDVALMILLGVHSKTGVSPLLYLQNDYRDQLTSLISFLNSMGVSISVFVDSLDESIHFFNSEDTNLVALQAFVNSVIDPETLHFALGDWGEYMHTQSALSFYVFIPEVSATPINITWARRDKIPIFTLKWNELQLINYVNYIFGHLRKQSAVACKHLPNICSVLAGQELCIKYMKKLRHPRDFHILFNILIEQINTVYSQRDPPFIATEQDLTYAFEKLQYHILKETLM